MGNSSSAEETRQLLKTKLFRKKTDEGLVETARARSAPADGVRMRVSRRKTAKKEETPEEEDERMRKEFRQKQSKKNMDKSRRRSVTVQVRQSRRQSTMLHENLVKINMFTNIREIWEGVDGENTRLGEGTWGQVKLVTKKDGSGTTAAVKILQLSNKMDDARMRELRGEISILQKIDHPHIVKIYEIYEEQGMNLYLVQEYLAGGELFDRVIELGYFEEQTAAEAVRQMLGAVQYLHSRGIVHRDLKLENFMYRSRGSDNLVLIDFGLSTKYNPGAALTNSSSGHKSRKLGKTMNRRKQKNLDIYLQEMVGSSYYMAPEVLKRRYGKECDVWSIGVIAYMLLSGHPPFSGENDRVIMKKVYKGFFDFNHTAFKKVSPEAKDFVTALLQYEPSERITAKEALDHIWLTAVYERKIRARRSKRQSIDRSVVQNLKNFVHTNRFKKLALQAVAYSTRYEDIKNLQEIFEEIDEDQDGYITLEELRNALKDSPYVDSEGIDSIFNAMDVDRLQKVHLNEFIAATLNQSILRDENVLLDAFSRLDVNERGEIDRHDLADLLGQNFDRAAVDKMLREFSEEHQDASVQRSRRLVITKAQFVNAMRKYKQEETKTYMSFQQLIPDADDEESEAERLNI